MNRPRLVNGYSIFGVWPPAESAKGFFQSHLYGSLNDSNGTMGCASALLRVTLTAVAQCPVADLCLHFRARLDGKVHMHTIPKTPVLRAFGQTDRHVDVGYLVNITAGQIALQLE